MQALLTSSRKRPDDFFMGVLPPRPRGVGRWGGCAIGVLAWPCQLSMLSVRVSNDSRAGVVRRQSISADRRRISGGLSRRRLNLPALVARRGIFRYPNVSNHFRITCSRRCRHHTASAVGRFWAEALGWGVSSEGPGVITVEPGGGFVRPDPVAVCVDVVAVPEPKTATKNRVHLDLATTSAAIRRSWSRALRPSARRPPGWAGATRRGRSSPIRRATSSAGWSPARSTGTPGRSPGWWPTARTRGRWPGSGARRRTGPCMK